MASFPRFSITSCVQRPESSGYVKIKSKDPLEKPIIQPNHLGSLKDQRIQVEEIKISRKLMYNSYLAPYLDYEVYPGGGIVSDDELLQVAKERSNTAYHLVGSCRMAPETDKTSVVDSDLRVRGFENLRVVDASIMPMIPSANVNAAVLVIAEKAATKILDSSI